MTHHPHDHLVRSVFVLPEHAAAELRAVLPAAVLARLDLATLRVLPSAFIDDALRGREADLLFTANGRGCDHNGDGDGAGDSGPSEREWIVHLLLEHQSRVDHGLPLRLLEYQLRIWERWRREHPEADRLPPIVVVVLCHGSGRGRIPRTLATCSIEPATGEARRSTAPSTSSFSSMA
ncbi:MAG: hypothetical protein EXS13_09170 [Planctomycetes bacterium]|nr:hypothetical protein [Planctomycetota bacterium]